ncbi:MAG: GPH family glycoside/pentoside/hexuronide:cation symporter [Francisellaceae bacterium]|jgi:GPH family glycoside/pentoside/hexuronide:cation symporter
MNPNLGLRDLFSYSLLALPIAFASFPIYILAPDFYASQYGVPLVELGLLLLFVRIIDAISGPIFGYLSDRFSRFREISLITAVIIFIIGFYCLFVPNENQPFISLLVGLTLCALAYSFIIINLYSLGAVWLPDQDSKLRISSYREGMTLVGILLATILPAFLSAYFGLRLGYLVFTIIFSLLLIISAYFFIKWHSKNMKSKDDLRGKIQIKLYFNTLTKDHLFFYGVYIITALAMASTVVLVSFFVTKYLMLSRISLGLFLFIYFLSGILSIPIWNFLSKKIGLLNAWLSAMIMLIIGFSFVFLLSSGDAVGFGLICLATGFTLGAELVLPPAILAILVDNDKQKDLATGYFAITDFITKSSLALSSAILLGFLSYLGFDVSSQNSEPIRLWLLYLYVLVPCGIKFFAIILLVTWKSKCIKNL